MDRGYFHHHLLSINDLKFTVALCCHYLRSKGINQVQFSLFYFCTAPTFRMPVSRPASRRSIRGFYDRFDNRRERRYQRFGVGFGRGTFDHFTGIDGAMVLEEDNPVGDGAIYNTEGGATATAVSPTPSHMSTHDDGSEVSAVCGYEAQFETPLDKKYVCPVCLSALRDPLQTKCGHRFCKVCLTLASG